LDCVAQEAGRGTPKIRPTFGVGGRSPKAFREKSFLSWQRGGMDHRIQKKTKTGTKENALQAGWALLGIVGALLKRIEGKGMYKIH